MGPPYGDGDAFLRSFETSAFAHRRVRPVRGQSVAAAISRRQDFQCYVVGRSCGQASETGFRILDEQLLPAQLFTATSRMRPSLACEKYPKQVVAKMLRRASTSGAELDGPWAARDWPSCRPTCCCRWDCAGPAGVDSRRSGAFLYYMPYFLFAMWLRRYLLTYLLTCLLSLSTYLSPYLSISAYLSTYLSTYLATPYLSTCLLKYLFTYLSTYLSTYLLTIYFYLLRSLLVARVARAPAR